jgi:hypothetical protein
MPVPNFLILGAQKSGTTWVSHRLMQHPQCFVVHGTYFFDNPVNYAKGIDWYLRFFDAAADKVAIGEKTPSYLWAERFPENGPAETVCRRVREVMPDGKFIVVLRNPVTRAVSNFNHSIRAGEISPLVNIDAALTGRRMNQVRGAGIFERGMYAQQLERWFSFFPRERFLILIFERDVVQRPHECLVSLCRFLGIDPEFEFQTVTSPENEKLSRTELVLKYYAPPVRKLVRPLLSRLPHASFRPQPQTIEFLEQFYADERARLEKLLGVDLECWSMKSHASRHRAAQPASRHAG